MLVKIGKYKGFSVKRKSYLLWLPVLGRKEEIRAKIIRENKKKTLPVEYVTESRTWLDLAFGFLGPVRRAPPTKYEVEQISMQQPWETLFGHGGSVSF